MAYAKANGFVVLTADLDCGTMLAASNGIAPSVVRIRAADTRPESIGAVVVAALTQVSLDLGSGALVTIEPGRTRIRVLPLRPEVLNG